jgi:hypothetical protein
LEDEEHQDEVDQDELCDDTDLMLGLEVKAGEVHWQDCSSYRDANGDADEDGYITATNELIHPLETADCDASGDSADYASHADDEGDANDQRWAAPDAEPQSSNAEKDSDTDHATKLTNKN